MKNCFEKTITNELITRINLLAPDTKAKWGKMDAAQMLAHCNVTYELVYESKHAKPNGLAKFFLKAFVKNLVVNEKPYDRNSRTAPVFIVKDPKNFQEEKTRLINYITKTQQLGADHFDQKESHSFGPLTKVEWNNMFYKHLDHHLAQFDI